MKPAGAKSCATRSKLRKERISSHEISSSSSFLHQQTSLIPFAFICHVLFDISRSDIYFPICTYASTFTLPSFVLYILFNISRSDSQFYPDIHKHPLPFLYTVTFIISGFRTYNIQSSSHNRPPSTITMRLFLVLLTVSTLAAAGPLPSFSNAALEARAPPSVCPIFTGNDEC